MEGNLIKCIIFDLGGVIFTNGTQQVISFLQEKYHINSDILKSIFYGQKSWDLRAGLITSDDFWKFIKATYSDQPFVHDLDLKQLWYDHYILNEGIVEILESLKDKFQIDIISGNIEDRVIYLLEKYALNPFFDFEVYSFTYHLHKNNPALYQRIIADYSLVPNECLFIDDNLDCLEAANIVGMKTILFSNAETLKKDLNHYDIRLFKS